MNNLKMVLVIAATLLTTLAEQTSGQNISVTNSTQLQTALDTARTNGEDDTIYLETGTYTTAGSPFSYGTAGNDNHSVTLSGGWNHLNPGFQSNDPYATQLDGDDSNPVLQILADTAGVNITFTIENLTILDGYTQSSDPCGAGIEAYTGTTGQGSIHLTIRNCLIKDNYAANNLYGGAIYSNGSLEVYDSRFLSNHGFYGGALFLSHDSDEDASASPIIIKNCYFEDNYNYGYAPQGSTIYTDCVLKISGSTFKGRSDGVSSSGPGSCIYGTGSAHLYITNSVFSGIREDYWGSAIQSFNGAMDITNCLFANNYCGFADDTSQGAVAYCHAYDTGIIRTINITNCTFAGNASTGGYAGAVSNRGGIMNINNCIFYDNDGETGVYNSWGLIIEPVTMRYSCYYNGSMGSGITDGGGNIDNIPMFVDDDVFRLSADSPCIDAGNNDLVPADLQDVDNDGNTTEPIPLDVAGKSRFRDNPFTVDTGIGTAPIVDIGAYEFVQTARFGYVNGKKNVKLTLKGSDHNDVTFALSGAPYAYGTTDPCDPNFDLIEIYNDNDGAEKAALTITTKSKTGSSVGSINCFGPMKSITAKNITFTGDMTIGSTMNPKAAVAITFDEGAGLNITSEMPIKSISLMDWWGSLTAPSVGSITAKSNPKLDRWGYLDMDVNVAGTIGTVKASSLENSWRCKSVKSITAVSTDDFYLTLTQEPNVKVPALGILTIKEDFDWSRITAAGNIGTITVGKMQSSSCFAGVADACLVDVNAADSVYDLPPVLDDTFNQVATIKSIAIKGIKGDNPPFFINSNIAAARILSAYIAYPKYDNSDNGNAPFGISVFYDPKTITIKDADGTHSWKIPHIGDAVDWLTHLGYDMQIRRD